jgi:hypothetical protein
MKKLIMLVEILKAVKEKFELDETDLQILNCWLGSLKRRA